VNSHRSEHAHQYGTGTNGQIQAKDTAGSSEAQGTELDIVLNPYLAQRQYRKHIQYVNTCKPSGPKPSSSNRQM